MTPEQSAELAKPIRVLQIIVGAMIAGVVALLVIALLIGPQMESPAGDADGAPPRTPVITYVAVACAAAMLVASLVLPQLLTVVGRRRIAAGAHSSRRTGQGGPMFTPAFFKRTGDAGRLCAVLFMSTIIGAAMLEGGALLGGVAYLVEGQQFALIAAVVLLFVLLLRFPTRSRAERWISEQAERIQQERAFRM
ncbi:MAG TPA: hypothetical protein VM243_02585 [Phycisphaerae bacterium]|nr:hypothetical protein [Phycisphaerae bacterium]